MPKSSVNPRAKSADDFADLRLRIDYVSPSALKEPDTLLRPLPATQVKRIADSIRSFGFVVPVMVRDDDVIASGVARVRAAKRLKLKLIPIVRLEHLTPAQARLLAIADNKLSEGREWDFKALKLEFAEIELLEPKLDLSASGFSIASRDIIFGRQRAAEEDDLGKDEPQPEAKAPITRLGDLFEIDGHRIICGDSTDPQVINRLVEDRSVRTVVSDLPYNIKIGGNVSGLGKKTHDEFAMASGEMDQAAFVEFLSRSLQAVEPSLVDGGLLYLFMGWQHIAELLSAAQGRSLPLLNLLVWAKTNAGMGSFYRSAHELIGVFKHGTASHTNNVNLGRDGRSRTNVLHYPGANTFTRGRAKALELHPTVKPVALIADLILDSSAPGEFVLDMFAGSGTTGVAAHRTDRKALLAEISPGFVDATIARLEKLIGQKAIHVESGKTLAQLRQERSAGEAHRDAA